MATGEGPGVGEAETNSLSETLRSALLTGVAVVVPILITVYVLTVAVGILTQILTPFVEALERSGVGVGRSVLLVQALAVLLLVWMTLMIGVVANFQRGQQALSYFDVLVERLPGVGGIYKSFRRMSDVLIESDSENFQSVVLVEFPMTGSYTIGFTTTETPEEIEAAAGGTDMRSLFLPLAPNPVMGGHLTHVPADRVTEVDMSVEEGMRTIVTMGVAVGSEDTDGLSQAEMAQLGGRDIAERSGGRDRPGDGDTDGPRDAGEDTDGGREDG